MIAASPAPARCGARARPAAFVLVLVLVLAVPWRGEAQGATSDGSWPHYGGDLASSRYSPLDQIRRDNVANLEVAWTWDSPDAALEEQQRLRPGIFKPTPIYAGGRLYVPTSLGQIVAVDPASGKTSWVFDGKSWEAGRPANAGWQHRGVEFWSDGDKQRILIAAHDRKLWSIDATTGKPDPSFGDGDGFVDLAVGLGREINVRQYTHNSPPIVCAGTVVVGSIVSDGPTGPEMPPGHVRGYDVRSGEMRWIFHTIPQQEEPGVETWLDDSWKITGNTNVWTTMSCDEELGFVYLPLSTPTNDWYGGHRIGDNLFAESLVALDARTGERMWSFQAVHHGLWDYDFPCAPNLVDIEVGGERVAAVAQVSKQGFTYVFDRRTGEPVWPIEERPVPKSKVPGERASPTQPFPTKPPAFERQGLTVDDLIDFTPELRQQALEVISDYQIGPIFTPPVELGADGKRGTLMLPNAAGGANWRGAAFDPETGWLYVPSMTLVMVNAVNETDAARSKFRYTFGAESWLVNLPNGLPIVKPPWGRITAIDLNRGEIAWQVAHGEGPRDHPQLAGLDLPRLGAAANGVLSNGGPLLTKELLFVIQGEEDPSNMLRVGDAGFLAAFDKTKGELLWETRFEPAPHGNPMTFLHQNRQYVVLSAGGNGQPAQLIAFALPSS